MRFAILACAVLSAGPARAAAISVQSAGSEKPAVVVVQGTLDVADGERFFTKIAPLATAMVRFQSNGGSVVTGIQIGEMIRLRQFHTLVPAGARCASACALAWLGGTRRFMGPGARIGLPAASDPKSGQVTGVGNALLGAYLNRVGLSYSAVIYVAQARPDSVTWLSFADAKRLGIEVTLLKSAAGKRDLPVQTRVGAARFRRLIRPGSAVRSATPQPRPGEQAGGARRVPRRGRRLALRRPGRIAAEDRQPGCARWLLPGRAPDRRDPAVHSCPVRGRGSISRRSPSPQWTIRSQYRQRSQMRSAAARRRTMRPPGTPPAAGRQTPRRPAGRRGPTASDWRSPSSQKSAGSRLPPRGRTDR